MGQPFEISREQREQHLKERPDAVTVPKSASASAGPLGLETRKRKKQTYTVYLDKELMSRVQRLSKQKDVAASAVIEACIRIALEQLEG